MVNRDGGGLVKASCTCTSDRMTYQWRRTWWSIDFEFGFTSQLLMLLLLLLLLVMVVVHCGRIDWVLHVRRRPHREVHHLMAKAASFLVHWIGHENSCIHRMHHLSVRIRGSNEAPFAKDVHRFAKVRRRRGLGGCCLAVLNRCCCCCRRLLWRSSSVLHLFDSSSSFWCVLRRTLLLGLSINSGHLSCFGKFR